jgi:hypothetical protein
MYVLVYICAGVCMCWCIYVLVYICTPFRNTRFAHWASWGHVKIPPDLSVHRSGRYGFTLVFHLFSSFSGFLPSLLHFRSSFFCCFFLSFFHFSSWCLLLHPVKFMTSWKISCVLPPFWTTCRVQKHLTGGSRCCLSFHELNKFLSDCNQSGKKKKSRSNRIAISNSCVGDEARNAF